MSWGLRGRAKHIVMGSPLLYYSVFSPRASRFCTKWTPQKWGLGVCVQLYILESKGEREIFRWSLHNPAGYSEAAQLLLRS